VSSCALQHYAQARKGAVVLDFDPFGKTPCVSVIELVYLP
jgi:hypothetical protein